MTKPITPPPELVQQWQDESPETQVADYIQDLVTRAAQWGADTELEACCEYMQHEDFHGFATELRAARRPEPQTLNSIALQMLGTIERDAHYLPEITDTLRRALEALPND
jgi:hypothetical protein